MHADTIFALSSGAGRAGVAVIRISGSGAGELCRALAGRIPPSHRATLMTLRDPEDGSVIDQALVLYFAAPRSFTGEDVVELQTHGSIAVVRKLSGWLSGQAHCRPAQPGEFSRRAFLHGRMDLVELEALGDLLAAETDLQRRLALEGSRWLRAQSDDWRERLIGLRARIEAEIDFADESDVIDRLDSVTQRDIRELADRIETATRRLHVGQRIRSGYRVAILGPPNAGKSSLVNALADRDIAIVSPIAGTTRDALEAQIDLDGVPVIFVDTAGLRADSQDMLEQEGMRRARDWAERADLVLWASPIDSPSECPNPDYLLVHTKADLDMGSCSGAGLYVSVKQEASLSELAAEIRRRALEGQSGSTMAGIVAHERQAAALKQCAMALTRAADLTSRTLDLRAEELRLATDALDVLIGRLDPEQILDAIFSQFCIGK